MPVMRKRTMPYLSAAFKGNEIPRNPNLSVVSEVDKSLVRELMEDDIDVELVRKEIEQLADAHEFLPITWNEHLLHFLHSLPLEIFIIVLIVIDLCLVLSTMILEVYVDEESIVESQQMSEKFVKYLELLGSTNTCYPIHSSVLESLGSVDTAHAAISNILAQVSANSTQSERRKRSSDIGSTGSSELSLPVENSVGNTLEKVIHVLHYLSIAILSVLVLEALVKIAAHGKHVLKNKMEIMDAIVNIASLVIDIMLTDMSTVGAIGKVLVILTLIWRVFRILNAIVITSRARYKFRIRLLKKTKQMLEAKIELSEKNLTRAKHEVSRLCQVATFYGAPHYEVRVFAEFAEEEKTARYGIQESLMQLLRVSDAIVGRPFSRRTNEGEQKEVIPVPRRRSSLPEVTAFSSRHSTTACSSSLARSASVRYESASSGFVSQLGANHALCRCEDRSSFAGQDGERACSVQAPKSQQLHQRSRSWPVASSRRNGDRQLSFPGQCGQPSESSGGLAPVCQHHRRSRGNDLASPDGFAAVEAVLSEAVLNVSIKPELLATKTSVFIVDCHAVAEGDRCCSTSAPSSHKFDVSAQQVALVAPDGDTALGHLDGFCAESPATFNGFSSSRSADSLAATPRTAIARPRSPTTISEATSVISAKAGDTHPSSLAECYETSGESWPGGQAVPAADGAANGAANVVARATGGVPSHLVVPSSIPAAAVDPAPVRVGVCRRASGSSGEFSSL